MTRMYKFVFINKSGDRWITVGCGNTRRSAERSARRNLAMESSPPQMWTVMSCEFVGDKDELDARACRKLAELVSKDSAVSE